jgi:hypothetical protein
MVYFLKLQHWNTLLQWLGRLLKDERLREQREDLFYYAIQMQQDFFLCRCEFIVKRLKYELP